MNQSLIPRVVSGSQSRIFVIRDVVYDNYSFEEQFLRVENSFFEIVASISAVGLSIDDERVVEMLGDVIDKKRVLTDEYNAWDQYTHLARWLIHLGSILEITDTPIEKIYLDAVLRSMTTMRRETQIGYSWQAYRAWYNRWDGIMASNRRLIKSYILANTAWPDARVVVESG